MLDASNPEPRFDFKTLRLTARFANAALVDFAAQVELMVNSLFDTELTKLDPTHGNNLLMNGVSQRQGDKISYVFQLEGRHFYATTRSALNSVEIEGVRLLTSSGTATAGNVHADFILGGSLRFLEPGEFDPFCFGPVIEDEVEVDGRLHFDGLAGRNVFLYVVDGAVRIAGHDIPRWTLVTLDLAGDHLEIEANPDARLLFGHADPIGAPVVAHGPFVMNTVPEIQKAIADYNAGLFGTVRL